MKKNVVILIFKIILTILFCVGAAIAVYRLIIHYNDDGLVFIVIAFTFFCAHLFAWIIPKQFFNFCWKMNKNSNNNYDYETGLSKIGNVGFGILITAIIFLAISFVFVF